MWTRPLYLWPSQVRGIEQKILFLPGTGLSYLLLSCIVTVFTVAFDSYMALEVQTVVTTVSLSGSNGIILEPVPILVNEVRVLLVM